MKKDIHPKYFENAKVTCACGASFSVGSTQENIHVEICSQCHPFFTGKEKLLDTAGRVDKFKARMEAAKKYQATSQPKKEKAEKPEEEKTLKKLKIDLKDNAK